MFFNPIIIVGGEPQSIFLEIFLKSISKLKNKKIPIILISSKNLLKINIKKFKKNIKLNELNNNFTNIETDKINLININYNGFSFSKKKITSRSNVFLTKSFEKALSIIKKKIVLDLLMDLYQRKHFYTENLMELQNI